MDPTTRQALELILNDTGDPVGMLDALKDLFEQQADSADHDDRLARAFADAALHLDMARDEFLRRGIR